MTCILVIKQENGKLLFGADRQLTSDGEKSEVSHSKIIKKNGLILGSAGNYRIGYLLLNVFKVPYKKKNESALDYIHDRFYNALKKFLFKRGIIRIASENTTVLLVGIEGILYNINISNDDTESTELSIEMFPLCTPVAFGSGSAYALGAYRGLYRSMADWFSEDYMLKQSLLVAGQLSAYCSTDIDTIGE